MKEIVIFIILMAFNDYTWYHVGKRIGEKKPLNLQEAIKARDKYIKIRKNYD
jgi:membrane protein DedA with SNARE-associated domain